MDDERTKRQGDGAVAERAPDGAGAAGPGRESVADIVADMRNAEFSRSIAAIDDEKAMMELLVGLADRIEAAAKREIDALVEKAESEERWANHYFEEAKRAKSGNAARLREALVKIERLNHYDLGCIRSDKRRYEFDEKILEIERTAKAALSAPPRNCDRFVDEDDAFAAWHDTLEYGDVVSIRNAFRWLFDEAGRTAAARQNRDGGAA